MGSSEQQNGQGRGCRIAISGSYGGLNLGDEAILACIVREIRTSLGPAEVTVFTRSVEDTLKRHDVERALPIREYSREEARAVVSDLDLLILGGGGILYDRDVAVYLREVMLAHEMGVPVVVFAVSAGPLDQPHTRKLVAETLNNVELITVRDRQGKKLLEDVGVHRMIRITADPALLMAPETTTPDALRREGLDPSHRLVGFSVREPGPAAPDIDIDHYHALLADAADFMVARHNAEIVFVPMERQKMDVQHGHAVIARMKAPQSATVLRAEYTSDEMLSLVGQLSFVVGMRLHMLIFAAIQGVPFVALPYASKVQGLVEALEMDVPPLKDFNAGGLLAVIDRSWDNQGELRSKIKRLMPDLQERARETMRLTAQLIRERATSSHPSHLE